jgi:hypothetical protein
MNSTNSLKTVSELADILQEPPARIDYIIRKIRLKPLSRIGIIRLFGDSQIDVIRQGLYGIQIRGDR